MLTDLHLHPDPLRIIGILAILMIGLFQPGPFSLGRNFDELLRVLAALQTADALSIATLADWQPGGITEVGR